MRGWVFETRGGGEDSLFGQILDSDSDLGFEQNRALYPTYNYFVKHIFNVTYKLEIQKISLFWCFLIFYVIFCFEISCMMFHLIYKCLLY